MALEDYIRSIPDFPSPGILFRDFTPLLLHGPALKEAIDRLIAITAEFNPDVIVAPEARGFVFGPAIAHGLGCGFLPARKPGKLPPETLGYSYDLEYGSAELHITPSQVLDGARVAIHDDLLATGGTVDAVARLAQRAGATVVGATFLIELGDLDGRERLSDHVAEASIRALLTY